MLQNDGSNGLTASELADLRDGDMIALGRAFRLIPVEFSQDSKVLYSDPDLISYPAKIRG